MGKIDQSGGARVVDGLGSIPGDKHNGTGFDVAGEGGRAAGDDRRNVVPYVSSKTRKQ